MNFSTFLGFGWGTTRPELRVPSEFRVFNAYPYLFMDPEVRGIIFPKFGLTIFHGDPIGNDFCGFWGIMGTPKGSYIFRTYPLGRFSPFLMCLFVFHAFWIVIYLEICYYLLIIYIYIRPSLGR